jgi:hypothetical protein
MPDNGLDIIFRTLHKHPSEAEPRLSSVYLMNSGRCTSNIGSKAMDIEGKMKVVEIEPEEIATCA